jgi:hypothetical protein
MGRRGPLPTPLRDYVISLYLRGELATLEEGALIAAVTRSRVRAWLHAAGIDWIARRQWFIASHRARGVAVNEGRRPRRPTKREMRRLADQAKRKWDRDNAPFP